MSEIQTNFMIVPGRVYDILYVDKNYPCGCECHKNKDILHVTACCSDQSYRGSATFYNVKNGVYMFLTGRNAFVNISRVGILHEIEGVPPIVPNDYQRGYLDGILSCI